MDFLAIAGMRQEQLYWEQLGSNALHCENWEFLEAYEEVLCVDCIDDASCFVREDLH